MSVRMHWTLQQAGWLWFRLNIGDRRYEADYGWCMDFPKDLLLGGGDSSSSPLTTPGGEYGRTGLLHSSGGGAGPAGPS